MNKNAYILGQCKLIENWLISVRRDFHKHPELGMEEFRTRDKIIGYLDEMGIEYKKDIANTGIVAIIKGKEGSKTVALRADMDALPIDDEKKVEYKSNFCGKMHACGHDAHMSILLGAAKILNDMKDNLKGNIKLIFQPAEETVGGAKFMIYDGVMENPKVDVIFGLHVDPEIPVGNIGIKYDQMNASSDTIKIIIHGESTHGAYPHTGIDAIYISGQIITAIQSIVSRNIDPRDCAVITIGIIHGGTQGNIIANKVEMIGTVRTINIDTRNKTIDRIESIVKNICESLGGNGELIREEGYPPLINDNGVVNKIKENGVDILGEENIVRMKDISLGVEDFAYFLQNTSGAFFRLGCRNEEKGIIYEGHTNLFDIDEDCLPIGVAMQVKNVLSILE